MSLRIHLLASEEHPPTGGIFGATACGLSIFRGHRGYSDEEWESGRVIGGARVWREGRFFPGHDSCKRCIAAWNKGAGI